jgi:uncharacterized protein (DUF488 family)
MQRSVQFQDNRVNVMTDPIEIFTIGHSNLAAIDFVESLRGRQIQQLVDVRTSPYSRFAPQFNRENLAHDLKNAGIVYVFAGEALGGRPTDPNCYKDGQLPPPKADYLKLVDYSAIASKPWYLEGIDRLIEVARDNRTAIMCSEEDPNRCHRHHLISQTLLVRGIAVKHIRKNGECQVAELVRSPENPETRSHQPALL